MKWRVLALASGVDFLVTMGCAEAFFFVFNLGVSAATISVATWLINKSSDITKITSDEYTVVPCSILIGVGGLIFIAALIGCCGNGGLLFFVLLLIAFPLEVTTAFLGYVYKSKAQAFVNDGLVDAIEQYDNKDPALNKALDNLQQDLKCCGNNFPSDWMSTSYFKQHFQYPKSCCAATAVVCAPVNSYKEGCLHKLTDKVKDNLSYIMGFGIGLAALQLLLGLIGACFLSQEEVKYERV